MRVMNILESPQTVDIHQYDYPIIVNDGEVTAPDLPGFKSTNSGPALREDVADWLKRYQKLKEKIPAASDGETTVRLGITMTLKIVLWNTMMDRGMNVAALASMLNVSHTLCQRIVDLKFSTKVETLEDILEMLGKRVKLSFH